MTRLPEFTLSDVTRWFGEHEIEKARGYLDAVSHLEIRPPRITASVQGGGPFPYRVAIGLDLDKQGKPRAVAGCSCPVGWMCKHAAAVMLHLLDQGKAQPKVRPDVLEWLEAFRESLQVPVTKKPGKKNSPGNRGCSELIGRGRYFFLATFFFATFFTAFFAAFFATFFFATFFLAAISCLLVSR